MYPPVYIRDQNVEWPRASPLGRTIYEMTQKGLCQTPEFKALVDYFGIDKCRKLYREYRDLLEKSKT